MWRDVRETLLQDQPQRKLFGAIGIHGALIERRPESLGW
jgi:hypothetical protein